MDERKEVDRLANLQSVTYTAATVKIICSRHSGSILSQPEPLVPLSSSSAQKAREAFAAALAAKASQSPDESSTESPTLDDTIIYDILLSYGLFRKSIDRDVVSAVIKKYYKGPAALDEQTFLDFLGAFQAPAYNYGQRLRRNAGRGVIEDVRELIIRGCDVNTADGEGLTSLHYASEFNRAGVIRELFALAGEDLLVNAKDKYGWSPLHSAVHHGSEECVKLLLKIGAKLTVTCSVGKTPLHTACSQDRSAICEYLIAEGADINAQDENGMTPIHDAAFRGNTKLYHALVKSSQNTNTNAVVDLTIKDKLGYISSEYIGNYQYEFPPELPATKC